MPWPTIAESIKAIDISYYQNNGGLTRQPFDVDAFVAANPDVGLVIIRALWPGGSPDPHYPHYFDGFTRNGVRVAAYLWPADPSKWLAALGDRVPKLIGSDHEDWSGNSDMTPAQLTAELHRTQDNLRLSFPAATVLAKTPYSRGSWLDANIQPSTRVNEYDWWLAHYPYPPYLGGTRQATSFAELDSMLPIDNGFTPYRGRVHNITPDKVKGWQASSRGQLPGIKGAVDLGYWLRSFVAGVYDEPEQPTPPPTDRPKVEVTVKFNLSEVDVTMTQEAG